MAVYFLDSSALVKRYVRETGSTWVLGVADPVAANRLYVAGITGAEVVSALARRARSGSLSPADTAAGIADFRYDFETQYRRVRITSSLIDHAMTLAEANTLRGYDAVQLAAALQVSSHFLSLGGSSVTLVSADLALNAAAASEGLSVEDPNSRP